MGGRHKILKTAQGQGHQLLCSEPLRAPWSLWLAGAACSTLLCDGGESDSLQVKEQLRNALHFELR
jgi:hypothetical protein